MIYASYVAKAREASLVANALSATKSAMPTNSTMSWAARFPNPGVLMSAQTSTGMNGTASNATPNTVTGMQARRNGAPIFVGFLKYSAKKTRLKMPKVASVKPRSATLAGRCTAP